VGDPFKDTSSVAMNPIIKFTTLFGLLAVEMAVGMMAQGQQGLSWCLAMIFLALNLTFVYRSFYGMRIEQYPLGVPRASKRPSHDGLFHRGLFHHGLFIVN
jgi:hypothetical protein